MRIYFCPHRTRTGDESRTVHGRYERARRCAGASRTVCCGLRVCCGLPEGISSEAALNRVRLRDSALSGNYYYLHIIIINMHLSVIKSK